VSGNESNVQFESIAGVIPLSDMFKSRDMLETMETLRSPDVQDGSLASGGDLFDLLEKMATLSGKKRYAVVSYLAAGTAAKELTTGRNVERPS